MWLTPYQIPQVKDSTRTIANEMPIARDVVETGSFVSSFDSGTVKVVVVDVVDVVVIGSKYAAGL